MSHSIGKLSFSLLSLPHMKKRNHLVEEVSQKQGFPSLPKSSCQELAQQQHRGLCNDTD